MADTNLLVLAREYKKLREEVKKVLSMPKGDKGAPGEKGEKGDKGDTGPQGFPGRDGKDGINGYDGKDGRDGIDGKDGKDGLDGVGVSNAYIDFDNSLVIVLSDGREVNAGFLSQETKENVVATFKQGAATINELLPPQTGNANKFLKTNGTDVSWDTLDGSDLDLSSPPAIGGTTPNAATFTTLTSNGTTILTNGSSVLSVDDGGGSASTFRVIGPTAALGRTRLYSGNQLRISVGSTNPINFFTAASSTPSGEGNLQLQVSNTASAVNYVQVTGAATTVQPIISAQGSDTNIPLSIRSKGTGALWFGSSDGAIQFSVATTTSSVNRLSVAGAATNTEPVLSAQGSDTNISMAFQSKGTGGISLSTGSTGTNLVNGTTVTAITRTASGFSYTSFPSVVISAPTTAGGVQATAIVGSMVNTGAAVVSGGTGYTVNDVLTVVGGTPTGAGATLTVTSVSGGVVTAATPANFGQYSVLPTNPVSVTGGTGSGATFTLTWGIGSNPSFTITNAGSGYVEQPTVTFSGGGGSGAAAYATVGSGTTVRSLGSTMSFFSPNGETFRVGDNGTLGGSFWMAFSGSNFAELRAANASSVAIVSNAGAASLSLRTNTSAEQLRVSHTASAVNYVQVTGAATTATPAITAQGSDTNVSIYMSSKGTGAVRFFTNGAGSEQFRVLHTAGTIVNYAAATGSATGAAPAFSVAGSDTNIDLALTPKGTGLVRFGTYTANMALTVQGYIEIKDSGGTTRRLAVIG